MLPPQPPLPACCIRRDKAVAERDKAVTERNEAIAERDEAIAERDFMLTFLQDLGAAFSRSQRVHYHLTPDGVEIRSLYPSHTAAFVVSKHIQTVRSMVSVANRFEADILAALETCEALAAAELRLPT
jgi:hypothetical protein